MRVTKRGKLPGTRIWTATCWRCKSEVEAVETELQNVGEDQRDGWYGSHPCPVCKAQMTFSRTERFADEGGGK